MTDKELKEAQELSEEQLEDVSGGTRILSACANEAEADDSVFIGILESSGPEEQILKTDWHPVG